MLRSTHHQSAKVAQKEATIQAASDARKQWDFAGYTAILQQHPSLVADIERTVTAAEVI